MKLAIFIVCALLEISSGSEPQVYEDVDDQLQVESNTRIVRDPFKQPRQYMPQIFRFQEAPQQDQRRSRYEQQQRSDLQNMLKRSKTAGAPLRVSLVQNWRVIDPSASSSIMEHHFVLPDEKNETSWNKVTLSTKKPVTSRKLKPSSYYEETGSEKIKRQDDNQIIYVNPELVKNQRGDYDLNALNALVGQPPSNQLEGLKRLLGNPHSGITLQPIKTPLAHPITEDVPDIPNPNTHPNIDTTRSTDSLQNQLDEAAKAQLVKALADAQKQALAHVEAQHQAIAKAQVEARIKALAEIARHNQGINSAEVAASHRYLHQEEAGQPLALPLKQEVPVNLYAPTHGHQGRSKLTKAQNQEEAGRPLALPLKQEVPVNFYAPTHGHQGRSKLAKAQNQEEAGQPLALPLKQEVPVNFYAPTHGHHHQGRSELAKAQNLKRIIVTKTHSVTQGQSPSAYQKVLLETRNHGVNQLGLDENADQHQYAARYAFGYKIKDVKMGNEYGHEEKRDGENAKGLYHVLLPDGRMQKVEYYADPSGYHAKVTYENLAHH